MAFIIKDEGVLVNTKLTSIGRKLLASGSLTFSTYELGDSEVDYSFVSSGNESNLSTLDILRPMDVNPILKYPIKQFDSSTTTKRSIGTLTPVESVVRNTAPERGFFSAHTSGYTIYNDDTYLRGQFEIVSSGVTGGTSVAVTQTSTFWNVVEGDYIMINWVNPNLSASTILENVVLSATPTPHLWYKIESIAGASSAYTLTVDKALPNFSVGSVTSYGYAYPGGNSIDTFYGSGETTAYWSENTLSFTSTCNVSNDDVNVWNMNITHTESMAGVGVGYEDYEDYGSSGYSGFKNYIGQSYDLTNNKYLQKSLGIIHFTNHSISNYYGEGFYADTLTLDLPTVVWHKNSDNAMGLKLYCGDTLKLGLTGNSGNTLNTKYYDLVDVNDNIVGLVLNDMKTVIVTDEELLAAMSYKSNRNWTYPQLNAESFGLNVTDGFLSTGDEMFVTYLFANESAFTDSVSYGFSTPLHCQYYTKFVATNNNQYPVFTLPVDELWFMKEASELANGVGFNANKFYVLYQKMNSANQTPDPTAWKIYDYTPNLNNYSTWSGTTIPPSTFDGFNYSFKNSMYTAGTTYDLSDFLTIPTTVQSTKLQFGDERFFYGNLNTDIQALIYKTKFVLIANSSEYNTSQNPTWEDGESVYVSEIGIFSQNDELVAISKLSNPIEKKNTKSRIFEISIDF